jgi:type IV pilus assembly protein PilF
MWRPDALLACVLMLALTACASSGVPRNKNQRDTPKQSASELHVKLGRGYMEQGQFETAHEKLERALQLDPSSVDGHTLMAILYERIDRVPRAEKHYRRAVELDPDDGSTNNNYGAYLCRLGRYAEADEYFRRALDDPFYKTPEAAWSNAGACAARSGDMAKAEGYFRRSLEIDPKDASALYELALISFRKNEFLRARAFIQRFESSGTPSPSMLDLAAQIEEKLGDNAAAAKYRTRLKSEFPDYETGPVTEGSNSP